MTLKLETCSCCKEYRSFQSCQKVLLLHFISRSRRQGSNSPERLLVAPCNVFLASWRFCEVCCCFTQKINKKFKQPEATTERIHVDGSDYEA